MEQLRMPNTPPTPTVIADLLRALNREVADLREQLAAIGKVLGTVEDEKPEDTAECRMAQIEGMKVRMYDAERKLAASEATIEGMGLVVEQLEQSARKVDAYFNGEHAIYCNAHYMKACDCGLPGLRAALADFEKGARCG